MENKFSTRLKELRGSISQNQFARKIGAKQTTYNYWESGLKEPSMASIIQISMTCGVSADWLLGLSGERITTKKTSLVVNGNNNATNLGDANHAKVTIDNSIEKSLEERVSVLESALLKILTK